MWTIRLSRAAAAAAPAPDPRPGSVPSTGPGPRSAGIAPGNLSYHFPRKEDLLAALLAGYAAGNDAFFAGLAAEDLDPGAFLARFRESFAHQYAHRGLLLDTVTLSRLMGTDFDYARVRQRRFAAIDGALERLRAGGHLGPAATRTPHLRDLIAQVARYWMHESVADYGEVRPRRDIPRTVERLRVLLGLYAP